MPGKIIPPLVPSTEQLLKRPQKTWLALDSELTLAQAEELANSDPTNELDYPSSFPWLRMGNVIVSGARSGPASLIAPVITLYQEGHKKIQLISGLHGDYPNTMSDEGVFADRTDEGAYEADVTTATNLEGRLQGLKIEVHDASHKTKDLNDWIGQTMRSAIEAGEPIILAWCFGVVTFWVTHHPQDPTGNPDSPIYPLMLRAAGTKIRDYVFTFWSWALRAQNLPSVQGDPIDVGKEL